MTIKLNKLKWGDMELVFMDSGDKISRVVYVYPFININLQYQNATGYRRSHHYHDNLFSQDVYVSEGDIQEIEPFDIVDDVGIVEPYGKTTSNQRPS
jgi:hypothetical protein